MRDAGRRAALGPVHWHVRWSRRINALAGGRADEMLCGRAAREEWPVVPVIDALFWALRLELEHCRSMAEWEARQ